MNAYAKIRAALEQAGDYIRSDLASERGAFEGHEGVSRIDEIKADLASNAAALAALAELERSAAEPVAWQARIGIGENWAAISASEYAALEACGKRQLRKLYAEPMPATKETK